MSTITHKRCAIQRTINWPVYHEQRAYLADLFAVIAYSGQAKRPLALGIRESFDGVRPFMSGREVRHFLRAYTFGPRYLRALTVGANRYALDGAADGWVSPNEAEHAALCLKAHYADREWHRALLAAVARAVARAVDAPMVDVAPDWQPYPYRFAREAA
jgi:sRNA-binding protein